MLVFFTLFEDEILIRARAEGPGMIGDFEHVVRPGDRFAGMSYDFLRSAGNGKHDLERLRLGLIDDDHGIQFESIDDGDNE